MSVCLSLKTLAIKHSPVSWLHLTDVLTTIAPSKQQNDCKRSTGLPQLRQIKSIWTLCGKDKTVYYQPCWYCPFPGCSRGEGVATPLLKQGLLFSKGWWLVLIDGITSPSCKWIKGLLGMYLIAVKTERASAKKENCRNLVALVI